MNTPFLSIITPCFNAGNKLNQTLNSILEQTFQDYEVIVKDGGSTDGSIGTIPKDTRIRLVRHEDNGIYDGMNEAVAYADGEYFYFLNCGDVLHDRNVLERVAEAVRRDMEKADDSCGGTRNRNMDEDCTALDSRRTDRHIYYGDVIEMKTGQRVAANPQMDHFAMFRYLPCHQACFYSRDLFAEREFDIRYQVRADYEHFLWCVLEAHASVKKLPLVIADYEGGGFSEKKENRKRSAAEHREITERYFDKKELHRFRRAMVLSLQPVREKLAQSKMTAGLYDTVKNRIYQKRDHSTFQ